MAKPINSQPIDITPFWKLAHLLHCFLGVFEGFLREMDEMAHSKFRFGLSAIAVAAVLGLTTAPASADIIFDSSITALGQGFGANPRLLTVQVSSDPNLNGTESGCVGFTGAAGAAQCAGTDASINPNGVIDVGGKETSNGNDIKNNSALLSASNITNANQIILVYNPSETGSNPGTTIEDITIRFFNSSGTLITSVDNLSPLVFADTGVNLGNGGVGFALDITAAEAAAINTACGGSVGTGSNCTTIALETTILNADDGPDSFLLFNRAAVVPEPASLAIFGAALAGLGL